jgi:dUTP pyrophosphatase
MFTVSETKDTTSTESEVSNNMSNLQIGDLQNLTMSIKPSVIRSVKPIDPKNMWKEFLCIERMEPEAVIPSKKSNDDAGYDLHAYGQTVIPAWGSALVHTKIKIALQPGTYGSIRSRSGLAVNNNIEVGAGVIDKNYQGEIMVLLRNFSDIAYTVQPKDRIAQLIISPYKNVPIKEVKKITDIFGTSDRGSKGFGSSGY